MPKSPWMPAAIAASMVLMSPPFTIITVSTFVVVVVCAIAGVENKLKTNDSIVRRLNKGLYITYNFGFFAYKLFMLRALCK